MSMMAGLRSLAATARHLGQAEGQEHPRDAAPASLLVFESSVTRWDDAPPSSLFTSAHPTFRALLALREVTVPALSPQALAMARDQPQHKRLARILLPLLTATATAPSALSTGPSISHNAAHPAARDKAPPSPSRSPSSAPRNSLPIPLPPSPSSSPPPFRVERVAQFCAYRQLQWDLYAALDRANGGTGGSSGIGKGDDDDAWSGRSDVQSAGSKASRAPSVVSSASRTTNRSHALKGRLSPPSEGLYGMPPFPPTLARRSLGLGLTDAQLRQRVR